MESSLPPKLLGLLSQLTDVSVLLKQEMLALLQAQSTVPVTASNDKSQAEAEWLQLSQHLEQAKAELQQVTADRDRTVEDLSRWEEAVAKASEQHHKLQTEAGAIELQLQRLAEEQRQVEFHRAQYSEAVSQSERMKAEIADREQNLSARESSIAQHEQEIATRSERLEGTRYWLESLLPTWLQEENIAPWQDALMDDAQHPRAASTAAGLLFSTLSLYTYAQRDTDVRAVADALRDVGRRLFAWLKERNYGDYDASMVAQSLAEHINRECSGRCEVEVPVPGSPAQNQTMLYQPRPGVSAQSVLAVQSWCVRGAKREVIHRAAVSV